MQTTRNSTKTHQQAGQRDPDAASHASSITPQPARPDQPPTAANTGSPFARDGMEESRLPTASPSTSVVAAGAARFSPLMPKNDVAISLRNAGSQPRLERSQGASRADAIRAQRSEARANAREVFPNKITMFEKNLMRDARREAAGPNQAERSRETPQQLAQAAARERRVERRASRLSSGIVNKEQLSIDLQKYSNYAINSAHLHGGNKARVIAARTGLTPIDVWEKNNPEPAMTAANNNPIHLEERAFNLGKISGETRAGAPAELKSSHADGRPLRMDTKHKLEGPKGTKTIRAQWSYRDNDGNIVDAPRLGTLQPSDTSSGEE